MYSPAGKCYVPIKFVKGKKKSMTSRRPPESLLEGLDGRRQICSVLQGFFLMASNVCCVLRCSAGPILCNCMDCSLPSCSVPGDFPDKNTLVGCHCFLQGIFPAQGSTVHLLPALMVGFFFFFLPLVPPGKPHVF